MVAVDGSAQYFKVRENEKRCRCVQDDDVYLSLIISDVIQGDIVKREDLLSGSGRPNGYPEGKQRGNGHFFGTRSARGCLHLPPSDRNADKVGCQCSIRAAGQDGKNTSAGPTFSSFLSADQR